MVSKATFAFGVGVGYVLGTRAGRERFDQLVNQTQNAWSSPAVQNAKGNAQSQAAKLYDDGKHVVSDQLHKRQSHSSTGRDSTGYDSGTPGNPFNSVG